MTMELASTPIELVMAGLVEISEKPILLSFPVSYSNCIRRRYAIRRERTCDFPVPGPEDSKMAGALDCMAWSWD